MLSTTTSTPSPSVSFRTAASSDSSRGVHADRAVPLRKLEPLRSAARGEHRRARALGDLHAVDAESAGAEHQHALPDAHSPLMDEAVIHARDGVGQDRRRLVRDARRQRDEIRRRHGDVVGVSAVALEADRFIVGQRCVSPERQ